MHYLWRAVDQDGEILESCVTKKRVKKAAQRFLKKALKRHGQAEKVVTDGLKSYPVAMRDLGSLDRREMRRWKHNHFNSRRQLVDRQTYKTARSAALADWQRLMT